jgi:hypothetical protein
VRARIKLVSSAIVAMVLLGAISLPASIVYNSSILAFMGLGLVFWGAVLLYVRPEEYARKTLLEAALAPPLTTLNQMIQELGYKGDATYLPPKYFTNPEATKVYISKIKHANLPTPEQTQLDENEPIGRTNQGLLITPPGIQLSKLMEKSLGTNFIRTDLKNLQQNLPKLFIENLEIAENLEIETQNDPAEKKGDDQTSATQKKNMMIHARITKPIYGNIFKETENPPQSSNSVGCPIRSAIAVALTKTTGKPVRIVESKSSEDGNIMEATYEILEE